ncbi:MAG: hypothetical protein ABIS45_02055 [Burkholderiales bacterium]
MLLEPPPSHEPNDSTGDAAPSVPDVLRAALAPLAASIDAAFIYGTTAGAAIAGKHDIDMMIIGRGIAHADVLAALIDAKKYLGRMINPSVYGVDEWTRKLAAGNRVMLAVLKQRKVFLIGSADRLPCGR